MKKNYVSPNLEVLRIKQGNVVMTSPTYGCSCDDECQYESESGT